MSPVTISHLSSALSQLTRFSDNSTKSKPCHPLSPVTLELGQVGHGVSKFTSRLSAFGLNGNLNTRKVDNAPAKNSVYAFVDLRVHRWSGASQKDPKTWGRGWLTRDELTLSTWENLGDRSDLRAA